MRAQSAVLNPSKRWQDFAVKLDIVGSSASAEDYDVKFSPNVVCLEVSQLGAVRIYGLKCGRSRNAGFPVWLSSTCLV